MVVVVLVGVAIVVAVVHFSMQRRRDRNVRVLEAHSGEQVRFGLLWRGSSGWTMAGVVERIDPAQRWSWFRAVQERRAEPRPWVVELLESTGVSVDRIEWIEPPDAPRIILN